MNVFFCFEGFLPQKEGSGYSAHFFTGREEDVIFYESPYRLVKTFDSILPSFFGADRPVSVCREISKMHEEKCTGYIDRSYSAFHRERARGEIVIVLGGKED